MRMVLVNQNYRFLAIWLPYPLTKEDLVTIGNQLFCIFIHRSFTHIFKIGILKSNAKLCFATLYSYHNPIFILDAI